MKKLLTSLTMLLCLLHEQGMAQKAGDVRWSLFTDPSPQKDTIHSIKVQSDGKIVAAGNSYKGSYTTIAVGRFRDGTPDSSFGVNGMVTTSLDSAHTVAKAVEIQPDGKIVVAGWYKRGTAGDFMLARYNQDGSADSSFGSHGIVQTDIGSGTFDFATALAIQTDGKIVAAGRSESYIALCRYNVDGSLDSSFDADGLLTVFLLSANTACMALQADGKIVVCCGNFVIRLNIDGSLDYSFGMNSVAATLMASCLDVAIQKDGKILVSGRYNGLWTVERLDTLGAHDNNFGKGGVVNTNFSSFGRYSFATAVCVQKDGRILVTGYVRFLSGSNHANFAVARYESNGSPDFSFGLSGMIAPHVQGFITATSYSAVINKNGDLVVAGTNNDEGFFGGEWTLACYYLGPPLQVHAVPANEAQITIAPNPAGDFLRIQSADIENGNWLLSLSDLTGKTLCSETLAVTNNSLDKRISMTGLPAATYLVTLANGTSRKAVKLMKIR